MGEQTLAVLRNLAEPDLRYLVAKLLESGKLDVAEAGKAKAERLKLLEDAQRQVALLSGGGPKPDRAHVTARRLIIQGRYMGLLRQLPKGKRSHIKKVARDKGLAQAIREMRA